MTTYSKGRRGRPWRRLCARVFAEERDCCRCGGFVDQTLHWRHPRSRSADHFPFPLSTHPHLALERSNVHLAHRECNVSAGASGSAIPRGLLPLGRRSRVW